MEILAAKEREWKNPSKQQQQRKTGTGPVLWPGMDGLGLHKLNDSNMPPSVSANDGSEPTNSDADDFNRPDPPMVRIKDDVTLGLKNKPSA